MMHPMAMCTAVVFGQVGYSVSKRMHDDRGKFRAAVLCYTTALAIVLVSVPWPFMPYGRSQSCRWSRCEDAVKMPILAIS